MISKTLISNDRIVLHPCRYKEYSGVAKTNPNSALYQLSYPFRLSTLLHKSYCYSIKNGNGVKNVLGYIALLPIPFGYILDLITVSPYGTVGEYIDVVNLIVSYSAKEMRMYRYYSVSTKDSLTLTALEANDFTEYRTDDPEILTYVKKVKGCPTLFRQGDLSK